MVGLCLCMWNQTWELMVGLEWNNLFGISMWSEGGDKVVGLDLFFWLLPTFFLFAQIPAKCRLALHLWISCYSFTFDQCVYGWQKIF